MQETIERLHGLDSTALAARLVDGARRAREIQIESMEDGDRASALRAIDTEARVVGALVAAGVEREQDVEQASAYRDVTVAVFRVVRANAEVAHALAAELDVMHRPSIADEIRETAISGIES